MNTLRPYLNCIRHTLNATCCLRNFPSQQIERHNVPEVEFGYANAPPHDHIRRRSSICSRKLTIVIARRRRHLSARLSPLRHNKELMLPPILISRTEHEYCLIEASINSLRFSVKVKQGDLLEEILTKKFMRFITQRAEHFWIIRRVAIEGYDISLLITNFHTEDLLQEKIVDFIVTFLEEVDKEINIMKLSVNTRGRAVATEFLGSMT